MATITAPRPAPTNNHSQSSLTSSQEDKPSPPPSDTAAASRPQSAAASHQQDGHLAPPPASSASAPAGSPASPPLNADQIASAATGTSQAQHPKRPGLSQRLTRIFSTRGESPGASGSSKNRDRSSSAASSSNPHDDSGWHDGTSEPKRSASSASVMKMAAQNGSATTSSPRSDSRDESGAPKSRRFVLYDDGTHEHHLKNDKRQEKLTNMFKSMFGKKGGEGGQEEHQLSLMSSWVDQLRNEKVASDQKGGPNCAHTLVEKYGKCHEVVGRGAFGIVRISHKADEKDPKKEQLYAVKEFRRRPSESPKKYHKRLTSEFCISSALRHPNVIHTLDLMKDAKGDFCEVMEYCAGGDLYTLVLTAVKLEVLEADCYFKQLMRGVEYIHEMGVSHRDLKPENLLLTTHGALKITDFGNGECFRMAWEKEAHMVAGLCGSAPYIAPEEYVESEFDPRAVDVWACGVIYMAMRTGRHLWRVAKKDEDEFYERYLEGRRDEDGYGPIETLHRARCRNVIYSILDPNPTRRITASQVLKSEWGREIKLCKAGEEGF